MPIIDPLGRLFGRLNLVDAAILAGALLAGAAGYHLLTAGNRVAPPYALAENTAWVDTELWLAPEKAFLGEAAQPGDTQLDPRSGEPLARILASRSSAQGWWVSLQLRAQRDSEGRWLYRGRQLLPGRELEIETESVLLLGTVASVSPPDGIAP